MANYLKKLRANVAEIGESYGSGRDLIRNALEKCFKLYSDIKSDVKKHKDLLKLYREEGFSSKTSTDAATKLIRLCIVKDAKRANPYAQVFRRASDAKVEPSRFLEWLDQRGGIERVRLSKEPLSDENPAPTRTWDEISEAAEERISTLSSKATLTHTGNQTVSFKGHTALLLVRRKADDANAPLSVVEVFADKDPRYLSVLKKHSTASQKPQNDS